MVQLGATVVMEGWHGQLNAGDDAFAVVISKILRRFQNTKKIIIFSDRSHILQKVAGLKVIESDFSRKFHFTRLKWKYLQNRASGFVVGGGSLFGCDTLDGDVQWWEKKTKSVAIGISVGPFKSKQHEQRTLEHLNIFNFVAFRDFESTQWAKAAGLSAQFTQAFDLAVLLPEAGCWNLPKKNEKLLGIALTGMPTLQFNDRANISRDWFDVIAARVLSITRKHGFKLRCFSLCRNSTFSDDAVLECFTRAGALPSELELYRHNGDPNKTLSAISECSHFVSSRLHGAIFAYAANTPLLFISYHQKCFQFAQTVGFDPRYFFDIRGFSIEKFESALNELLISANSFQASMQLDQAKQLARKNFDFCN
jgi:polysaccharide pyruvyl transferase WcaK-like protein